MERLRIGIRMKVVLTLAAMAAVPLGAVLGFAIDWWATLQREIATQNIAEVARAESRNLSMSLMQDVHAWRESLERDEVLSQIPQNPEAIPGARRDELDRDWPHMSTTEPAMASVLNHPISRHLRRLMKNDERILQVFVTDRLGQEIAATGRTKDFYQGDEDWWTESYNEGRGKIVVEQVQFDFSVQAYPVDICLPLLNSEGRLLGVAKVKLDLNKWFVRATSVPAGSGSQPSLIGSDGQIIWRAGLTAESVGRQRVSQVPHGHKEGVLMAEGELRAYMPLKISGQIDELDVQMPDWTLVLSEAESEVMAPVNQFIKQAIVAALLVLLTMLVGGMLLVDRLIVRRINHLQKATHRVASGDFTARAVDTKPFLGADEIDDLAHDFDQMVAQVRQSHLELQSNSELKTNFIRVASHELRTPVSYILGMYKLLRDNRDPDRLVQALQSISTRAKRLDDIIQAMFKLMPGQLYEETVRYEDIVVSELLGEVYMYCFPFIEQRRQRLIMDVPPDLPTLRADKEKLRDIIENLVFNAVKFTPDSGEIRLDARGDLNGMLSISITDQGPGIPEADLPHLFQPFYSGGDVLQHSTGQSGYQKRGIGLGLAIVRHFVELHGGTVTVSSNPTGSTFTVTLPATPPARLADLGI